MTERVTSIIPSCLLLNPLRNLIERLTSIYPEHPVLIIDNGSQFEVVEYTREVARLPSVRAIFNDRNVGHGLAVNQGLAEIDTRLAFLWHTDVIIHRSGFIEPMVERFEDNDSLLACGEAGICYQSETPCVMLYAAMIDRDKALACDPLQRHGAVAAKFFRSAERQRFTVADFQIQDYVTHLEHATYALMETFHPSSEARQRALDKLNALDSGEVWTDQNDKWLERKAKYGN